MNWAGRKVHTEHLLLAACGVAVLAVLLNAVIQSWTVPGIMRFVPLESSNYAFTSSLQSVWNAAEPHVGRYFRAEAPAKDAKDSTSQPLFTRLAVDIRESLAKQRIRLARPADLAALGINPGGAAALAMGGEDTKSELLLVLPILDEARFLDTAERVLGKRADAGAEPAAPAPRLGYPVRKFGRWYVAFPEASTAVLSTAYENLAKAVNRSDANLEYFRSGDQAIRAFADLLADRPKAWIKGSLDLGRAVRPLRFVVGLDEQRMFIGGSFSPPIGQSRQLQQALAPGTSSLQSFRTSMGDSNLAALLDDPALPQYIDLLEQIAGDQARALVEKQFPALWGELSAARTARRIQVAIGGDARGVPDVLLGIAIGKSEADKLVFSVQSKLRLQRDGQILKAALRTRAEKNGAEPGPRVSPAVLLEEGLLSRERGPLWTRYRYAGGAHKPVPPFTPADFGDPAYVREQDGYSLQYILPPMTDDDFRYRLSGKEHDRASVDDLKGDRFRLCSIYLEGMLWFGNDADTLRRSLRGRAAFAANTDLEDAIRVAGADSRSKAVLFLQPRQLLDQALLHPDPEVNDAGRSYLSDLSHYRAILLTATTDKPEQLHVTAHFLRY